MDQKVKAETERIEALFAAVERAYALVCETDRSLSETIRVASQKRRDCGKREQANRDQLAIELAKQLKDGEPCPVCGSVHHEMPARVGIESLSFKEADSELEKRKPSSLKPVRWLRSFSRPKWHSNSNPTTW
ncbi:hypothetical protein PO124_10560 [Bacillus licheniformis]|nr:hypothetical protein [Bacillus licheniformis]